MKVNAIQIVATMGLLLATSRVQAVTMYWDTAVTSGIQSGSGTWDTSNTAMWSSSASGSSSLLQWTSSANDANFYTAGTSAVTVGAVTANSLIFTSGATGYTLSSGTLAIGSGGIVADESATINSAITFGANQNWTVASGKTLNVGSRTTGFGSAYTLNINGQGTISSSDLRFNGGLAVNQTAGSVSSSSFLIVGEAGNASYTIGGGTLQATSYLYAGRSGGANGVITQTGGLVKTGTLQIGNGCTGSYHMYGGRLVVTNLSSTWGGNSGSYNFDFDNGGTLVLFNGSALVSSYTMKLRSGGGKIDLVNGQALTLASLQQDSSSTGGAFEKLGNGSLTLTGASDYTGATTISNGALVVNGTLASSLVTLAYATPSSGSSISPTLAGSGTISGNVSVTTTGGYAGVINLSSGGLIAGNLGVAGGAWNGLGSVSGKTTSSSGVLTIGSGANLVANGGLDVAGGSIVAASSTGTITGNINYTSGNASTFAGVIAGSGKTLALNNSSATLILSGSNTYSGGTTINAGTLQIGNSGALGAGTVLLNGGGLCSNSTTARTITNAVEFGGNVVLGNSTNNGNLTFSAASTLTNNSQLTTDSPVIYNGSIAGSGYGITKAGSSILVMWGSNTFSGGFTLNSGIVRVACGSSGNVGSITSGALGTGTVTLNGGTLTVVDYLARTILNPVVLGGDITLGDNVSGRAGVVTFAGAATITGDRTLNVDTYGNMVFSGVIGDNSQGYGITKTGAGNLTLSGKNTFTGATVVNAGTLALSTSASENSGALSYTSGVTVNSGATLYINNWNALGGYPSGPQFNDQPTGTPTVTINSGTMTMASGLNCTLATVNLNNAYVTSEGSGDSDWGSWNFRGNIYVSGGTSTMTSADMTLCKDYGGTITVDSGATLNVTGAFVRRNYSDMYVTGTANLVKNGAGAMILRGANTYTGDTIVNAGTLELTSTGSILLDINSGTTSSQISVNGGSLLLDGLLGFDLNGVTSGGTWTAVSALSHSGIYGAGFHVAFTFGTTTHTLTDRPTDGVWSYTDSTLNATATFTESTGLLIITIPEPATITLLTTAMLGLIVYAWRKRK